MGFLLGVLTLPVLGAPRIVRWLAVAVASEAEQEMLDEGRIRARLMDLQAQFDAGEIGEAEYDLQEEALLERLSAARERKTALAGQP